MNHSRAFLNSSRNTAIGFGGIILWASSLPFGKRCSEDLGPLTTVAVIYFVSGLLGIAYFAVSNRIKSFAFLRNWQFYARTFLFGLYCLLLYFAMGLVPRSQLPFVTLLNYLWPTFTMLLSVYLLKQKCRLPWLLIGSALVVVGLSIEILGEQFSSLLSAQKDSVTLLAFLSAFLAAFVWGCYSVLNRIWGAKAGETQALPFVLLFSSVAMFGLRTIFSETSTVTPGTYFPLIYLCITPIIANICWDIGTRLGNINLLSLLSDGLPWASLTVTQLYLGVPIGSATWISAFIIVTGAVVSRYSLLVRKV
jgi:drug/metabolite transporter (DMT)-like permease